MDKRLERINKTYSIIKSIKIQGLQILQNMLFSLHDSIL